MKRLLFVGLFILAAGCATTAPQRDATEAFGLATERIGRLGEDEFTAVRSGIIRLNTHQAILDGRVKSTDLQYDGPATAAATAERISACKTLRMYGDLLMRLASDDRSQFVRRSAITFADSAAETMGASLNPRQQAAIDGIIDGLTRIWTERRKENSIREVVLAFEDVVNTMADRILADFILDGRPTSFLAVYEAEARQLQSMADSMLDTGRFADMGERRRIVLAAYMARNIRIRAVEIGLRMQTAIETLKKANAEIVSGVRNNTCNAERINEYGRLIQQIGNLKQVLPR
ncbi:hypothetical protein [Desulfomicrobium salsuginis]